MQAMTSAIALVILCSTLERLRRRGFRRFLIAQCRTLKRYSVACNGYKPGRHKLTA
jgi:hypothetical protein